MKRFFIFLLIAVCFLIPACSDFVADGVVVIDPKMEISIPETVQENEDNKGDLKEEQTEKNPEENTEEKSEEENSTGEKVPDDESDNEESQVDEGSENSGEEDSQKSETPEEDIEEEIVEELVPEEDLPELLPDPEPLPEPEPIPELEPIPEVEPIPDSEPEVIDEEPVEEKKVEEEPEPEFTEIDGGYLVNMDERAWTILIYMSADNNLESAAINDLLEMEASKINTDIVSIFALVDRNPGYCTTNDNFSGTRLYKIKTGKSNVSKNIESEEIECRPLGLSVGMESELDMSSEDVLSNAFSYIKKRYPANNYGLIIWGHGTGWRGEKDVSVLGNSQEKLYKGFAYDETSGTYMTLKQLGSALSLAVETEKIDFIGFDTCYGGEIEVAYELKNVGKLAVGSEGLLSFSGWDYKKLFDYFAETRTLTSSDLCLSVIKQFKEIYAYTTRTSIAAINLEKIDEYVKTFNSFCETAASYISTLSIHDEVMDILYDGVDCKTEKYTYGREGYDIYLDVNSLVENLNDYLSKTSIKSKSNNIYKKFTEVTESLFIDSWASDRTQGGLGVYFATLSQGGYLASTHPASYINGKNSSQIEFVKNCTGYVPAIKGGKSLLDKLFYFQF